jgi:hypothetical protein
MSSVTGTVTSCGPSQDISLQYTCTGPSCVDLNGFPNTTCTTDGTTLTCSNNVVCPGPTNYTSQFTLSQTNLIVSLTQNIVLKDFCQDITLISDGTTGGTNATKVDTGPCGPGHSTSSTSSSSSTKTASSSPTLSSSSTYKHRSKHSNPRQLQPLPRKALYVRERNMDTMYANPRQRQPLPLKALYAKERDMDTMYVREKSLLQTLLAPLPPPPSRRQLVRSPS